MAKFVGNFGHLYSSEDIRDRKNLVYDTENINIKKHHLDDSLYSKDILLIKRVMC